MTDFDTAFRALNTLAAPDLASDIERRSKSPSDSVPPAPGRDLDRGATQRRLPAALVAFAVFIAGAALVWSAFGNMTHPRGRPGHAALDPWAGYGAGWTRLPDPPQVRSGTATVWAGDVYLDWGGKEKGTRGARADGYAFDPATGTWSTMPPAPLARIGSQAVWTGTQALFWYGFGHDRGGVAYDPATRIWKVIPPSPLPNRGGAIVWTGTEMIVWGGSSVHAAAFNTATWTWRRIADGPNSDSGFVAVWTGSDVLVLGGDVATPTQQVATPIIGAYDPVTDSWRLLRRPPLSPPYGSAGVWMDGRLIAYDPSLASASFDPSTDRWTRLPRLPIKTRECPPAAGAVAGRSALAYFCGQAAVWDGSAWHRLNGGPSAETVPYLGHPDIQAFPSASLSAAGPVVVFKGVASQGPCYSCPGAPHPFWVYRPLSLASHLEPPPPG